MCHLALEIVQLELDIRRYIRGFAFTPLLGANATYEGFLPIGDM